LRLLQTENDFYPNASAQTHNKHSVDAGRVGMNARERIEFLRAKCHAPSNKSAFARWLGQRSAQVVDNWIDRDSIPPKAALKVAEVTGATTAWIQFGQGEPFTDGPRRYVGEASDLAEQVAALHQSAETRLLVASQVLTLVQQMLRVVCETTPGVAPAMRRQLEAELERRPAAQSRVLAEALKAVEEAERGAKPLPHLSKDL
jgi:DNA-binding transcriptional regulator YiaG